MTSSAYLLLLMNKTLYVITERELYRTDIKRTRGGKTWKQTD